MNDHYLNPSGVSKFWDKTKQLIESSGSSGITNIPAGGGDNWTDSYEENGF